MRDFPFDTQELKIKFSSKFDTSLVVLNEGKFQKSTIVFDDIDYLKDGYIINDIKISKSTSSGPVLNFADSTRPAIYDEIIFNLILTREGYFLFFKLFLVLSFHM